MSSGLSLFLVINHGGCGPEAPGGSGESSGGGEVGGPTTADDVPTSTSSTSGGDEQGVTDADSGGSGTDTGDVPAMPEPCVLVKVDAEVALPLDMDGAVGAQRLTLLSPGGDGSPARVMTTVNEWFGDMHSNYRVRSFVVGEWPGGVVETEFSLALTRAGHGLSRFARLADGSNRFGYVWIGDPRGDNKFDTFYSIFDADAWDVTGEVKLVAESNAGVVDLLATPTFTEFLATYESEKGDVDLDGEVSGFSLGVLDAAGVHVAEPVPVTLRSPAPGSALRTFWAGDRVALAMAHNACAVGDPLCTPHSVAIAHPVAVDEHGLAVDGYAVTRSFAGLEGTSNVSRPMVAAEFGRLWTIWYEGEDQTSSNEHRTLRGVVLDEFGAKLPWPADDPAPGPIDFLADTRMGYWPNVLVSEFGITVGFDNDAGSFEIHNFDFDFKPLGAPISIALGSGANVPGMAALTEPRSLLLTWYEGFDSDFVQRMVRLECDAD